MVREQTLPNLTNFVMQVQSRLCYRVTSLFANFADLLLMNLKDGIAVEFLPSEISVESDHWMLNEVNSRSLDDAAFQRLSGCSRGDGRKPSWHNQILASHVDSAQR